MKNGVEKGEVINDYLAVADGASGDVVTLGAAATGCIAILASDIVNGETGVVSREGVFDLPLKSGDTPAVGDQVWWDPSPGEVTTTSAGNWLAGRVHALPGDDRVHVKID